VLPEVLNIFFRMSSFESSISYTHQFRDQLKGTFRREGSGKSQGGKKFSPAPGYLFQLRIFNHDSKEFSVYLENCGEEEVKILEYLVHYPRLSGHCLQKKLDFSLQPHELMGLSGNMFSNFGIQNGRLFILILNLNFINFIS
jgi:hypothetical protein